eukprot:3062962-Pyramimonas_sp.AAC.1
MQIATQSGCRFWLGAQGAVMTEDVVPAAAVLAVRRLKGYREAGKQLWPSTGPCWDYPPLAQRPPLSKYEICATPPQQSRHEQMAQELEVEMIDDPPGIAPPSPSDARQPTPKAAPTAKACATDTSPQTQSASASSAQHPIDPSLGATPAGHAAGADALDEAIVRAMVSKSGRSTQDTKWLVAMSCCREALRPITANITQTDWDRRPIFKYVRMGDFIIVTNW